MSKWSCPTSFRILSAASSKHGAQFTCGLACIFFINLEKTYIHPLATMRNLLSQKPVPDRILWTANRKDYHQNFSWGETKRTRNWKRERIGKRNIRRISKKPGEVNRIIRLTESIEFNHSIESNRKKCKFDWIRSLFDQHRLIFDQLRLNFD